MENGAKQHIKDDDGYSSLSLALKKGKTFCENENSVFIKNEPNPFWLFAKGNKDIADLFIAYATQKLHPNQNATDSKTNVSKPDWKNALGEAVNQGRNSASNILSGY